jgi:hypothetical protein
MLGEGSSEAGGGRGGKRLTAGAAVVKGIPKHEQAEAGRVVAPVHMEGKAATAARFAGAAVTAGGCMGMETEPMPAKARAFTGLGALPRVERGRGLTREMG